jgi:hypothetical protein
MKELRSEGDEEGRVEIPTLNPAYEDKPNHLLSQLWPRQRVMRLLKPCTQGELILTKGGWIIDKKIGIVNNVQNWRRRRTLWKMAVQIKRRG